MKNLWYFWHWYTPPVDIRYVHSSHKPEYFLCATTVWIFLIEYYKELDKVWPDSKYRPFSSRVRINSTNSVLILGSRGKSQRSVNRHLPYLIPFVCFDSHYFTILAELAHSVLKYQPKNAFARGASTTQNGKSDYSTICIETTQNLDTKILCVQLILLSSFED